MSIVPVLLLFPQTFHQGSGNMSVPTGVFGGGIASAIAFVIVTLIRARSGDRDTVIKTQQDHSDRLTKERNQAVQDRDEAYEKSELLRDRLDAEHEERMRTEGALRQAREDNERYLYQLEQLREEVALLSEKVLQLDLELTRLRATGAGQ